MGADKLAENTPKCPKTYLPKLSTQAQKVVISMKKASLGLCVRAIDFDIPLTFLEYLPINGYLPLTVIWEHYSS